MCCTTNSKAKHIINVPKKKTKSIGVEDDDDERADDDDGDDDDDDVTNDIIVILYYIKHPTTILEALCVMTMGTRWLMGDGQQKKDCIWCL